MSSFNDNSAGYSHSGHQTSNSFKAFSTSRSKSRSGADKAKGSDKATVHLPLPVILGVGTLVPLIAACFMAWFIMSDTAVTGLADAYEAAEDSTETTIYSKLDSMIEAEVEAFRMIYESAVRISTAGSILDHEIYDLPLAEQNKQTAFWSQSMAQAYHLKLIYFIYQCNGHIIGTGYDEDTHEFIAKYTDLHVYDLGYDNPQSNYGVKYPDNGCNIADSFGQTTMEEAHTTRFTEPTYWKEILKYEYDSHTTTFREDGRHADWYVQMHKSDDACMWSLPYAYSEDDPKYYVNTVAKKAFDVSGHEHGVVAVDFSVSKLQDFVSELTSGFGHASAVVLTREKRVMASADGDNVHVYDYNGNTLTELYEYYDYAESIARDSDNERYLSLAKHLDEHEEFFDQMKSHPVNIGDEAATITADHINIILPNGDPMLVSSIYLTDDCHLDLTLFVMINENEFLRVLKDTHIETEGELVDQTTLTFAAIGGTIVVEAVVLVILSMSIILPLQHLVKDFIALRSLDFSKGFEKTNSQVREIREIGVHYAELKKVVKNFRCFVPPQMIGEMVLKGKAAGERIVEAHYVAVVFCDIANFTKACHHCEDDQILKFTSAFLGGAADLITKKRGTVIDFFGDQIFGIFNAPREDPDYLRHAMECGTELIKLFLKAKSHFIERNPSFKTLDVRVGLHSGSALCGNIGSAERMKYVAVGENVNLGSAIENLNKRYGSRMACSSDFLFSLHRQVKNNYVMRPMEFLRVKRRTAPVLIYEVAGLREDLDGETIREYEDHTDMFEKARANKATKEELEEYIRTHGPNAKFVNASTMLSADDSI